ncbi:MAG: tryptophan synthase subunit alpha [Nitrospinota bacterium]|nr:tryptophan synthase subunit alpha [Nitrospinota bacterium]
MSRITDTMERLRKERKSALAIFLTGGDPSISASKNLILAAAKAGADIIEIGIPFSDPLADGPVIQRSFLRAIKAGANVSAILKLVESVRKESDIPLVFMVASTLVINHGVEKFMKDSAKAGVDGIILPDAPPEEAGEFVPAAHSAGLDTIFLAAPTSTPQRLKTVARLSTGFLYYINVSGVTGDKSASAADVGAQIRKAKKVAKAPVMAGFGVKTPEQAKALSKVADGVIIGSAAVDIVASAKNKSAAAGALGSFVGSVRKAMDSR